MKEIPLVAALLAVLLAAPGNARADGPGHAAGEPAGPSAGQAVWPLDPRPVVVRRFEPPTSAWGAGHRGVDLLGRPGQQVRSALPGTVTFAGTLAGRGVVVVDHGSTRTTYEPVEATLRVGTTVRAGDGIGTLQTGLSHCFPRSCLHWGLISPDRYLDPLSLLGVAPVRLLPLEAPLALMPWGALVGMPFAVFPR